MTSESTEFDGRSVEMRKSEWLASEELIGVKTPLKLVIEKCHRDKDVEFDKGRKEKVVYSLSFKGAKKRLVLNAHNRHALENMYGYNVKEWVGKQVELVRVRQRMMGKDITGIGIIDRSDVEDGKVCYKPNDKRIIKDGEDK